MLVEYGLFKIIDQQLFPLADRSFEYIADAHLRHSRYYSFVCFCCGYVDLLGHHYLQFVRLSVRLLSGLGNLYPEFTSGKHFTPTFAKHRAVVDEECAVASESRGVFREPVIAQPETEHFRKHFQCKCRVS